MEVSARLILIQKPNTYGIMIFPGLPHEIWFVLISHLKNYLGIEKIHIGIGGTMGGQQLLEWAIEEPKSF